MYLLKPIRLTASLQLTTSFTFHYVSIKTKTFQEYCHHFIRFTFHYVSIKTHSGSVTVSPLCLFTFHYVSIKTHPLPNFQISLHYLHSTMYLLKPKSALNCSFLSSFTFHYVSIKTIKSKFNDINIVDLHSTMYLLKLTPKSCFSAFTHIYIPLCIY